jgi:hypothetical protein
MTYIYTINKMMENSVRAFSKLGKEWNNIKSTIEILFFSANA